MYYYLTRHSFPDGELSFVIGVWSVKPVREACLDGYIWVSPKRGTTDGFLDFYTPADCYAEFGTYPDSDRMMIKVKRPCPT